MRDVEVLALPREAAEKTGLFGGESFMDALVKLSSGKLRYAEYSYADQSDVYVLELGVDVVEQFRALLPLLKPKSAGERVERLRPEKIEFLTHR